MQRKNYKLNSCNRANRAHIATHFTSSFRRRSVSAHPSYSISSAHASATHCTHMCAPLESSDHCINCFLFICLLYLRLSFCFFVPASCTTHFLHFVPANVCFICRVYRFWGAYSRFVVAVAAIGVVGGEWHATIV